MWMVTSTDRGIAEPAGEPVAKSSTRAPATHQGPLEAQVRRRHIRLFRRSRGRVIGFHDRLAAVDRGTKHPPRAGTGPRSTSHPRDIARAKEAPNPSRDISDLFSATVKHRRENGVIAPVSLRCLATPPPSGRADRAPALARRLMVADTTSILRDHGFAGDISDSSEAHPAMRRDAGGQRSVEIVAAHGSWNRSHLGRGIWFHDLQPAPDRGTVAPLGGVIPSKIRMTLAPAGTRSGGEHGPAALPQLGGGRCAQVAGDRVAEGPHLARDPP
jgi:hypothetical protein